MTVTVELTYDLGTALGVRRLELSGAATVEEVLVQLRARFQGREADFDRMTRAAVLAVNGVLVCHRSGRRTPLADRDRVSLVHSAAGG